MIRVLDSAGSTLVEWGRQQQQQQQTNRQTLRKFIHRFMFFIVFLFADY